jgi:hypothetical protein
MNGSPNSHVPTYIKLRNKIVVFAKASPFSTEAVKELMPALHTPGEKRKC